MPEIEVIRHVVRPHRPMGSEKRNPAGDMLIVVHRNPEDPNDPTEFGHHIRLEGLAYRKEMWGLGEYAQVIDQELKDLERFYFWNEQIHTGDHPLAEITEHYYTAPRRRMQNFAPGYLLDAAQKRRSGLAAVTPEARHNEAREVALDGLADIKRCLASTSGRAFPCKGMTGLSLDSATKRSKTLDEMGTQTERTGLKPGKGLDGVRQFLTDRTPDLEVARGSFVDHALMEASIPDQLLKKIESATGLSYSRRGE